MRRGILLLIICSTYGCAIQNKSLSEEVEIVRLDFTNCVPETSYKSIDLKIPKGYKLYKSEEHGFCEYMMTLSDKSVLYVSTNIYAGSTLNYQNRLNRNIQTYSTNRSENDTIRNAGVERDGKFWLEWIMGNYVVGYINATDSVRLNESIRTVKLIE